MKLRSKGYTVKGRIDFLGVHGIDDTLEFTYRPIHADEFDEVCNRVDKARSRGKETEEMAAAIVSRVSSWNVEDDEGEVKVSKEAIIDLVPSPFIARMFRIITGESVSDAEKN